MTRHARLTVLELGAPAMTWASCNHLAVDDWLVVAQQSDEGALGFAQRVRLRAQRLCAEGAQLDAVDVFTGPERDCSARRAIISELSGKLVAGGRLTLWAAGSDARTAAELAEFIEQLAPLAAQRELAMQPAVREQEERSGVRHAAPTPPTSSDYELERSA